MYLCGQVNFGKINFVYFCGQVNFVYFCNTVNLQTVHFPTFAGLAHTMLVFVLLCFVVVFIVVVFFIYMEHLVLGLS